MFFLLAIEWLKRWQDDFDYSDMRISSFSTSTTPMATGVSVKGKEHEKAT
jgi:hypothetical protein